MRKLFFVFFTIVISCSSDDPVIPGTLEVAVGDLFEVMPRQKVVFKEIQTEIRFISFDNYTFNDVPPNTTVTCELKILDSTQIFKMYVSEGALYSNNDPVDPDPTDNFYNHHVPIGEYLLSIKRITWVDPEAQTLVVKSAQFILE